MEINKLLGFYELKDSGLPSVPWRVFDKNIKMDSGYLWTVRTAVYRGADLNLPRKVGVSAEEAYEFALKQKNELGDKGIVIVYPYFIAEKSGTLLVEKEELIIEAVYKDLWNLVTHNKCDFHMRKNSNGEFIKGKKDFFTEDELNLLFAQIPQIKVFFKDNFRNGKAILLEWSFAYSSDVNKKKTGDKYLVFYEARAI